MNRHLRLKAACLVLVLVVSGAVGVYPIVAAHFGIRSPNWLMDKQLKLGLDLRGGVHLVLRVQTEYPLRLETEAEMERLRAALQSSNIPFTSIATISPTQFRVDGMPPAHDAAFRQAASDVQANFDRAFGVNGSYTFTMKPNVQVSIRDEAVVQMGQTIERRVNDLGVTESSISRQGTGGDRLQVQLPGVTDVERAKQIMGSPGLLELKIVERGPAATREALEANGPVPQDDEIVPGAGAPGEAGTVYYVVRKAAPVTGRDLRSARPSLDENSQPVVIFTLNKEGGRKFGKVTGDNIGRQLAIILDGRVRSAPRLETQIFSEGRILGGFSEEEVQNLSLVLRSGALPAPLTYLEEQLIGPSLGEDSIRHGVAACIAGLLLIITFLLAYYRWSGINAVVALLFNLVILLGLMAGIGAVVTLPGIAGFVLTMGIGVDSSVLIFERIKEELEADRGVRASIDAGFTRVFWTLVDTHVAALISAAFLFQFGTGPIRGFAVTLFIGLISNLFTSMFVSRTLFEMALAIRNQRASFSI
jgi:preprotein translocase subunit SecD